MIYKYRTLLVFWSVCLLSCASIGLLVFSETLVAAGVVLVSIVVNVVSILIGEGRGFVRSPEMRRAYEPVRHFKDVHVMVLLLIILVQVGSAAYVLLTAD